MGYSRLRGRGDMGAYGTTAARKANHHHSGRSDWYGTDGAGLPNEREAVAAPSVMVGDGRIAVTALQWLLACGLIYVVANLYCYTQPQVPVARGATMVGIATFVFVFAFWGYVLDTGLWLQIPVSTLSAIGHGIAYMAVRR
jgi:hypothetical protein